MLCLIKFRICNGNGKPLAVGKRVHSLRRRPAGSALRSPSSSAGGAQGDGVGEGVITVAPGRVLTPESDTTGSNNGASEASKFRNKPFKSAENTPDAGSRKLTPKLLIKRAGAKQGLYPEKGSVIRNPDHVKIILKNPANGGKQRPLPLQVHMGPSPAATPMPGVDTPPVGSAKGGLLPTIHSPRMVVPGRAPRTSGDPGTAPRTSFTAAQERGQGDGSRGSGATAGGLQEETSEVMRCK